MCIVYFYTLGTHVHQHYGAEAGDRETAQRAHINRMRMQGGKGELGRLTDRYMSEWLSEWK